VTLPQLAGLFCPDYYTDRSAFLREVERFAARTSRSLSVQTAHVDGPRDLCVTAAELRGSEPRQLLVLCCGIHGIEGYAGSAIIRHLLAEQLARVPRTVTIWLVHALNPFGFAEYLRVNAANVDLNRNCEALGDGLFSTDSTAYQALAHLLAPRGRASVGALKRAGFYTQLLAARTRHGEATVRQASLAGQYCDPQGVFFGGDRVQPEIAFFQRVYSELARAHSEVLVVDLHTGYGVRGEAYALFPRAETPAIHASTHVGVTDASGQNRTYTVHGDLIAYCYRTAKDLCPNGLFDGVVIELGTHGLSLAHQLSDLHTVVLENQLRHHGSDHVQVEPRVRDAFRELFYPSAPAWRARVVQTGSRGVEALLRARSYLRGA
jgi:hypothetical protein